MMELLASTGTMDSLEELCDGPFKPKRRLYGTRYAKTRFSGWFIPRILQLAGGFDGRSRNAVLVSQEICRQADSQANCPVLALHL